MFSFLSVSLEQGLQISVSVLNKAYFLPIPTLEHGQGQGYLFPARITVVIEYRVQVRVPSSNSTTS